MDEVIFLEGADWDGNTNEICFHAQLSNENELVSCRIPAEILRDIFGATCTKLKELNSVFSRHRAEIEQIMARLIQAERYEVDGTVVIQKQDISP